MYGVSPGSRRMLPLIIDAKGLVMWGAAAGTTAVWIVQPFSWFKKTFIDQTTDAPNSGS